MNNYLLGLRAIAKITVLIGSALMFSISQAQTAPPPSLGEETKGKPALAETSQTNSATSDASASAEEAQADDENTSIFGASIVESRRESGQVYSIELQHSNAPTQYIEETDSDGNIEYESNDLEETPNLPKWKLGSW